MESDTGPRHLSAILGALWTSADTMERLAGIQQPCIVFAGRRESFQSQTHRQNSTGQVVTYCQLFATIVLFLALRLTLTKE